MRGLQWTVAALWRRWWRVGLQRRALEADPGLVRARPVHRARRHRRRDRQPGQARAQPTVTVVDRHPLFSKPRDYYENTGTQQGRQDRRRGVIGVPAGIYGELKQIVVGRPGDQARADLDFRSRLEESEIRSSRESLGPEQQPGGQAIDRSRRAGAGRAGANAAILQGKSTLDRRAATPRRMIRTAGSTSMISGWRVGLPEPSSASGHNPGGRW